MKTKKAFYLKDKIEYLLSLGNRELATIVFEIYFYILYSPENEKKAISNIYDSLNDWHNVLFDYYNGDLYDKKLRDSEYSIVSRCLTSHGKIMYKAAQWQLVKMVEDTDAYIDAGMLCLSYYRIIEYELNQRIIKRIIPFVDQFIAARDETIRSIEEKQKNGKITKNKAEENKKTINERWGERVLEKIRDSKENLELGSLGWFFQNFMQNQPKDVKGISCVVEEVLRKEGILSSCGLSALRQNKKNDQNPYRFVDITNKERREKFRNPPAHTRFVSYKTAMECVNYVNKALVKIHEYTVIES